MGTKNGRILHEAFEAGRGNKRIVAYHGTSLATLESILREGKQMGSEHSQDNEKVYLRIRRGDLFVFPIKYRSKIEGYGGAYEEGPAFSGAERYAGAISFEHHIMQQLSLPIVGREFPIAPEIQKACLLEFNEHYNLKNGKNQDSRVQPFIDYLLQKDYSFEDIDKLYLAAKAKKGVVLGYSDLIFQNGDALPGNDSRDVRVVSAPINSIVGIEPLDDASYTFLDNLHSTS